MDEFISKAIVDEFLNSGKYVTKHGIRMRILDKVIKCLKIDKKDLKKIHEQSYVHPDCSAAIEKLMESLVLSQENRHLFLKILSGDHHDYYELYKLAIILKEKSRRDMIRALNIIFAVDAGSEEYTAYIDHLQFKMNNLGEISEDPNEIHVRAVRKLYEQFVTIDSKDVYKAILHAFDLEEKDDIKNEDDNLAYSYIEFIGIENIDKVKSFIEKKIEKTNDSLSDKNIEKGCMRMLS